MNPSQTHEKPTGLVNASAEVTLDGRVLLLRFRAFTLIEYWRRFKRDMLVDIANIIPQCERMHGKTLPQLAAMNADSGLGEVLEQVCKLLWVAALDQQPDITLAEVERMIAMQDLEEITMRLVMGLVPTLPDRREATAGPAKANPTVASSTNNGSSSNGLPSEPVAELGSQNFNS